MKKLLGLLLTLLLVGSAFAAQFGGGGSGGVGPAGPAGPSGTLEAKGLSGQFLFNSSGTVDGVSGSLWNGTTFTLNGATIDASGYLSSAVNYTASIDVYVSTTGSDSTGTGTAILPYRTIQNGLTQLAKFHSPSVMTLHLVAGTYTEQVTIPNNAVGKIKIIGNPTNPANVIFRANASAQTGSCISSLQGNNVKLYVDGITFSNNAHAIEIEGKSLEVGYCIFNTFSSSAVYAHDGAAVVYQTGYAGNSYFHGTDVLGCYGTLVSGNSTCTVYQNITLDAISVGYFAVNGSEVGFAVSSTQNINLSTVGVAGYAGVLVRSISFGYFAGTMNINGGAINSHNLGIQDTEGSLISFVGDISTQMHFSNLLYGMTTGGYANMEEGNSNANYTYTNVTVPLYLSQGTAVGSNNYFDAVPTFYDQFQGNFSSHYGLDNRYIQTTTSTEIYVSPLGSDSTGQGIATNPFATIQRGLLEASKYSASNNVTLFLGDGTYNVGTIVIPSNTSGVINIVGSSANNVIIDGGISDPTGSTTSEIATGNIAVTLSFVGITFRNSGYLINNSESRCIVVGCKFENFNVAIYNQNAGLVAFQPSPSPTTFDGNNVLGSIALQGYGIGLFSVQDAISIQNVSQVSQLAVNCYLYLLAPAPITLSSSGAGITAVQNSNVTIAGAVTLAGQGMQYYGLSLQNGSMMRTIYGTYLNITNSMAGIHGDTNSTFLLAGGETFAFNTVGVNVDLEKSCLVEGTFNTPIKWSNLSGTYGYDYQYLKLDPNNDGTNEVYYDSTFEAFSFNRPIQIMNQAGGTQDSYDFRQFVSNAQGSLEAATILQTSYDTRSATNSILKINSASLNRQGGSRLLNIYDGNGANFNTILSAGDASEEGIGRSITLTAGDGKSSLAQSRKGGDLILKAGNGVNLGTSGQIFIPPYSNASPSKPSVTSQNITLQGSYWDGSAEVSGTTISRQQDGAQDWLSLKNNSNQEYFLLTNNTKAFGMYSRQLSTEGDGIEIGALNDISGTNDNPLFSIVEGKATQNKETLFEVNGDGVFSGNEYRDRSTREATEGGEDILTDGGYELWNYFLSPDNWSTTNGPKGYEPTRTTEAHGENFALQFQGGGDFNTSSLVFQSAHGLQGTNYQASFWDKGDEFCLYESDDMWQNQYFYNFTGALAGNFSSDVVQLETNNYFDSWDSGTANPTAWNAGGYNFFNTTTPATQETIAVHSAGRSVRLELDGINSPASMFSNTFYSLNPAMQYRFSFYAFAPNQTGTPHVDYLFFNSDKSHIWNFNSQSWDSYTGFPLQVGQYASQQCVNAWQFVYTSPQPYSDGTLVPMIYIDYLGGTPGQILMVDDASLVLDSGGGEPTSDQFYSPGAVSSYTHVTMPSCNLPITNEAFYTQNLSLYVASTNNYSLLDDAILQENGTGTDIFTNSGFENWTSTAYSLQNWGIYTQSQGTDPIQSVGANAHSGNYGVNIFSDSGGNSGSIYQVHNGLSPVNKYQLSIWAKDGGYGAHGLYTVLNDTIDAASKIWNFSTQSWDAYSHQAPDSDHAYSFVLTGSWGHFMCPLAGVDSNGRTVPFISVLGEPNKTAYFDDATMSVPGTATSIDIFKHTSPLSSSSLTSSDEIFSERFIGDNKYAFKLSGAGDLSTDLPNGISFVQNPKVPTPISTSDATSKGYVDNLFYTGLTAQDRVTKLTEVNLSGAEKTFDVTPESVGIVGVFGSPTPGQDTTVYLSDALFNLATPFRTKVTIKDLGMVADVSPIHIVGKSATMGNVPLIEGTTEAVIRAKGGALSFFEDGTNWYIY